MINPYFIDKLQSMYLSQPWHNCDVARNGIIRPADRVAMRLQILLITNRLQHARSMDGHCGVCLHVLSNLISVKYLRFGETVTCLLHLGRHRSQGLKNFTWKRSCGPGTVSRTLYLSVWTSNMEPTQLNVRFLIFCISPDLPVLLWHVDPLLGNGSVNIFPRKRIHRQLPLLWNAL